jgi:hypothetical protein
VKRAALILAVLWMALRDRWFLSRWNPWGAASGRTLPTQDVIDIIEKHGQAWMRTMTGTGESAHKPPNRPIQ